MKAFKGEETSLKYEHGVLVDKNNLFTVTNTHDNTSMLLHFNPADIKNYNKADKIVLDKMDMLLRDNLEMARQHGQAGIKKLSNCSAEVEFTVNGKSVKKSLAYEVKISNSPSRIGLVALQPVDPRNPVMLVASVYLAGGLHQGKAKKYCKQAYLLDKHSLFSRRRPNAVEIREQSSLTLSR
jgi:hypothetical protein